MKKDLNQLMDAEGLDAVMILGSARHNPDMYYFTSGLHISSAALVKRRGSAESLFCYSMERDEAARTGLQIEILEPFTEFLTRADGDRRQASAFHYRRILERAGVISGRLAVGGITEVGEILDAISDLGRLMPGLAFSGLKHDSAIRLAMATKDEKEIGRIRQMGEVTTTVVGEVADFLSGHRAKDGALVKSDGTPLTIGEVKRRINRQMAELGAENPHGTIFAAGRDAGVPHSAGVDESPVPVGESIVFDIFPCEAGGGYYYDFTRTWCLGYAPDGVLELYEDVLAVYHGVVDALAPGTQCMSYQDLTCDLFEARQHPTVRSDARLEAGYTHAIGHGLGLFVHELPNFGQLATERDILEPGAVFTIEPGLYYPDRGAGVRLEDTFSISEDGMIAPLVEYPMDLVLPIAR